MTSHDTNDQHPTDARDTQWGDELADLGLGGLVAADEDPLAALDEEMPSGVAGALWGSSSAEREVAEAMAHLERLLARATRHATAERRAVLLTAVDRALADPKQGFLRRLRIERSRAVRQLVAAGRDTETIAERLGVSTSRVRQLVHNNRNYVSAERALALEALADRVATERAAKKAARETARSARAEAARRERVALGRDLQARLDAGALRTDLQAELGMSRQRVAALLAEARVAEAQDGERLPEAA